MQSERPQTCRTAWPTQACTHPAVTLTACTAALHARPAPRSCVRAVPAATGQCGHDGSLPHQPAQCPVPSHGQHAAALKTPWPARPAALPPGQRAGDMPPARSQHAGTLGGEALPDSRLQNKDAPPARRALACPGRATGRREASASQVAHETRTLVCGGRAMPA